MDQHVAKNKFIRFDEIVEMKTIESNQKRAREKKQTKKYVCIYSVINISM